jgi:hypothetical protein
MVRASRKALSALSLWSYASVALAQLPRGETAESTGNDEVLGALWIFAAIAIYVAFKESKQKGLKVNARQFSVTEHHTKITYPRGYQKFPKSYQVDCQGLPSGCQEIARG